jgi:hypothetical protein
MMSLCKQYQRVRWNRGISVPVSGLILSALLTTPVLAMEDLPVLNLDSPLRMDFSGSWEKDFRRSDNWEEELSRIFRLRQEAANRDRSTPYIRRANLGPAVTLGNLRLNRGRGRGANIVDLARLAEYISRQSTVTIRQNREEVRIERDGDADLVCGLSDATMAPYTGRYGAELCGWDRQQLVFEITLPDELMIMHRFSVAADAGSLRMVTSVISKGTNSFTLITVYNRYDAPADEFDCVQTLSRGRVCSQSSFQD